VHLKTYIVSFFCYLCAKNYQNWWKFDEILSKHFSHVVDVELYSVCVRVLQCQTACVTAWLIVSVAVERYIFVCHATRAHLVCTVRRAAVIAVCVVTSMSLVALPSALRYHRTACRHPVTNETLYEVQLTELGRAQPSAGVYTWTLALLRSIVPLVVLVAFNARIVSALRTTGTQTTTDTSGGGEERRQRRRAAKNRSVTVMLVVVVVVFVVCILPDAVMSVGFRVGYVDERNQLAKGVREFSDALLALCSAVNFVVYCLCSSQFRAALVQVFRRSSRRHPVEL